MRAWLVRAFALALLVVLSSSCGSDSTGPLGPDGETGGGNPVPIPEGVLLDGDDAQAARDALTHLPPSAVDPSLIQDGLLSTRLLGMIAASATVAEVNTAIEAAGTRIVTMSPGSPFVTLKVPAVSDLAAARTVAALLVESGAFVHASPAFAVEAETSVMGQLEEAITPLSSKTIFAEAPDHLLVSRVLPTWNLAPLGLANQERIKVLVPDEYASIAPHQEIDAQSMGGYGLPLSLPGPEIYPGNNGFVVSGIIGANVDETVPTGISPYPAELMDIRSRPIGGLSWYDLIWMLSWDLASGGDRFVLNTGLGYNDPAFETHSRVDRYLHAIAWRIAATGHYDSFVHVMSAPASQDEWWFHSPFVASGAAADLRELFAPESLSPADAQLVDTVWGELSAQFPAATAIATNVLMVGATDRHGLLMPFSVEGNVRAIGIRVLGPCVSQDPAYEVGFLCDGDLAYYTGTSMAAAQVSGLAAYMLSLRDVSPARVREAILHSSDRSLSGVVDAYDAVLALDGPDTWPIHESLLDVAGFESEESDGRFDQYDLAVLAQLRTGSPSAKRAPEDVFSPVYRLDLNGDMDFSPTEGVRFDLDNDGDFTVVSQMIEGESMSFDENSVTDFDIVCYYAYSDVYSGDLNERAQYVVPGHSGIVLQMSGVPDRVGAGQTAEVTVTAGLELEGGGVSYVAGISIAFELDGAEASPSGGVTDDSGSFTSTVTFGDSDNEMFVGVWAETDNDAAYTERRALRNDEIQIIERYVSASAEVFATYSTDVGVPSMHFIESFKFKDSSDYSLFQHSLDGSSGGSGAGMTVIGTAITNVSTRVDLGSGTDLYGVYLDSDTRASLTLSNPNFNIQSYQASAGSYVDLEVEFVVWGKPATYTMHGNVSSEEYDIELSGPDGDLFECDSLDAPCFTISNGGELAPGSYKLSAYHGDTGRFRWHQGCTSCPDRSGSESSSGSLELNFELTPGG